MRGHVNKTNFANRRQRIVEFRMANTRSKRIQLTRMGQQLLPKDAPAVAFPTGFSVVIPMKDPDRYAQFRKNIGRTFKYATDRL